MSQILLNLPAFEALATDSFITSECNIDAYNFVNKFPFDKNYNTLLIIGEKSSGKSHLAKIWQEKQNAEFLTKENFNEALKNNLQNNIIIEDINFLNEAEEETVFHIYNRCKLENKYLLFTSSKPIYNLSFTLPDLKSRISASLITQINQPSESFQRQLFHKHFLDMQVSVPERVIDYITPRIQRNFQTIYEIADLLNKKSVETKRPISIPFVKEVMRI